MSGFGVTVQSGSYVIKQSYCKLLSPLGVYRFSTSGIDDDGRL
jgi:hypothetical protein